MGGRAIPIPACSGDFLAKNAHDMNPADDAVAMAEAENEQIRLENEEKGSDRYKNATWTNLIRGGPGSYTVYMDTPIFMYIVLNESAQWSYGMYHYISHYQVLLGRKH